MSKSGFLNKYMAIVQKIKRFFRKLFCGNSKSVNWHPQSALKKQNKDVLSIWNNQNYSDYGLERFVRLGAVLSIYLFPTLYIRQLSAKWRGWLGRKMAMDFYTVFNLLLPVLILSFGWYKHLWVVLICSYLGIATVSYLLNLIILRPEFTQPSSYLRSTICLFLNYLQLVADFAVVYAYLGECSFKGIDMWTCDAIHMFYYSMIISSSIGLGDITPITNIAIVLTILQSLITFIFIYVILSQFATHIQDETYANKKAKDKQQMKQNGEPKKE